MRKTLTAIIRIKTDLPSAVQECLDNFGEGARLDYDREEMAFALCNTPVQHGYCRPVVAEHIATALQWMQDTGVTSPHVEIVQVEWAGQDRVQTGTDEDGNPIIEEQLFQVATQDIMDIDGNPTGETRPVYLGRMA